VPFLCVGCGKVARLVTDVRSVRTWFVIGLLGWAVLSGLRYHPRHLSYFNELAGGPANGWRHFIDSNYDWGQDLFALKDWLDQHPEAHRDLQLAHFGVVDPRLVGIRYRLPPGAGQGPSEVGFLVPCGGPRPGWFAVSVNYVCGLPFPTADGKGGAAFPTVGEYAYFRHFRPAARAGDAIFIYHLDASDVNRVRERLGLPLLGGSPEVPRDDHESD
jgi:hypothetical protein